MVSRTAPRFAGALAAAVTALLVAGCDGGGSSAAPTSPHPSRSAPTQSSPAQALVKLGQPFVNADFKIVVTKVALNQPYLPADAKHRVQQRNSPRPTKGQFVLVYLTVTNIGTKAATFSTSRSVLIDAGGTRHSTGPYPLTGFQDLGDQPQPPGATVTGYLPFDVPPSVRALSMVEVQPDPAAGSARPPTGVKLG
jgi:hypothetical protein